MKHLQVMQVELKYLGDNAVTHKSVIGWIITLLLAMAGGAWTVLIKANDIASTGRAETQRLGERLADESRQSNKQNAQDIRDIKVELGAVYKLFIEGKSRGEVKAEARRKKADNE